MCFVYVMMIFQASFEDLVQFMSSGPSHVLVLSQVEGSANVIPAWREFIGPADIEEARREQPERLVTGYYAYAAFIKRVEKTSTVALKLLDTL